VKLNPAMARATIGKNNKEDEGFSPANWIGI
jgi:hypothetical protein